MKELRMLGFFLTAAGVIIGAGSAWLFYRYQTRQGRFERLDYVDDDALKKGSVFFIAGGVSLFAVGIFLLFKG